VVEADETPFTVAADAVVVLDPDDRAWASLTLDPTSARALPRLFDDSLDALTRASLWTTARNGVHHGRLDPSEAVALLAAGIPFEDQDASIGTLAVWAGDDGEGAPAVVHEKLLTVVADPVDARARIHAAFRLRAETAPAGSDLQLAAVHGWLATCDDSAALRTLLDAPDLPGLVLDSGLRWRALRRLSSLAAIDLDELDDELSRDHDAKAQIAHAWAHARLPDAEAKAWAWQRFTGEVAASNYEVEAIGTGFWQTGRDALLSAYVDRYFDELPGTTAVRAGWGLADGARYFFPITVLAPQTLSRADELIGDTSLDLSLRRVLIDAGDELRSRLLARERYAVS
jgi:aminopeptidase N